MRLIALCGLALSLTAAVALAQTTLIPVEAVQTELAKDPNNPTLLYILAVRQLAAGDKASSVATLERLVETGDGFLPPRDLGFAKLNGDAAYEAVRKRFEAKLPAIAKNAKRAFTLADRQLLPEGIAYDSATQRVFVSSTYRGSISVVRKGQVIKTFVISKGQSVMGLAVDAERNRLIAVVSQLAPDKPRDAIIVLNLQSLKIDQRIEVPDAKLLNDVAMGALGELYVTDSGAGRVWRVSLGENQVTPLIDAGALRGPNGIAFDQGVRRLYVATSRGVVTAALGDSTNPMSPFMPLSLPPGQSLALIDGLYLDRGSLIGIQNSTNPGRVIRVKLSTDGTSATDVETLLSHHHADIVEPTTASLAGNDLLLLATTNVTAMNPDRTLKKSVRLRKPVVLRVPTR
jgi:DNA-binding beta-propeller fold protein YncE